MKVKVTNLICDTQNHTMKAQSTPRFRFVLRDKITGRFPKIDAGLISEKNLTDSLEETYIFDNRDNEKLKEGYYNAIYRGVAEFEPFRF